MGDIKSLLETLGGFDGVLIVVLLLLVCGKYLIDLFGWFKNYLEGWRKNKNGVEEHNRTVEERIEELEEENEKQDEKLSGLEAGQLLINQKLDEMKEQDRKETIALYRSTLLRLWHESKEQGYMTESQFEVYSAIAGIYKDLGGNGLFRHKILPEMDAMDVRGE